MNMFSVWASREKKVRSATYRWDLFVRFFIFSLSFSSLSSQHTVEPSLSSVSFPGAEAEQSGVPEVVHEAAVVELVRLRRGRSSPGAPPLLPPLLPHARADPISAPAFFLNCDGELTFFLNSGGTPELLFFITCSRWPCPMSPPCAAAGPRLPALSPVRRGPELVHRQA